MNNMPLVSVCTLAYNHAPYIRECLDGILMQKTNFAFELLIHDDASTDGTADIIREYEAKYPDIVKPIYQTENQYSKGVKVSITYQFPRAKGKYIALCEGDDYWTDPLKLQKQVDFMEANPDYGLCYTSINMLHLDKSFSHEYNFSNDFEPTINELMISNPICTLTTLFRKDLYAKYIEEVEPQNQNWKMGDYPIWIWFALHSKIKYLNGITGVYRRTIGSASNSSDKNKQLSFLLNVIDIKTFFKEKYDICNSLYLHGTANTYTQCRGIAIDIGRWDIIKKEIKTARLLKNWKRVIKLKVLYIARYNKRILNFINSRI